MKKLSLLLLILLLPLVAKAHDFEVENAQGVMIYYVWINNSTELEVSFRGNYYGDNNNEYSGEVIIPESVVFSGNTYSVTSIGKQAFYGCSGLTSIEIPNSVTSIGEQAFYGCSGLTSIEIPNSVTSIGEQAFYGCSGLTSIEIPNSVTSIGRSAFDVTPWYNKQPDGLVYAGKVAYKYKGTMPANTDIVIDDGTVGIAVAAFSNCNGLLSVTIPNSVMFIGGSAFYGCSGITSVTIPNSVTSIGGWAFRECSGLTSITIPNSVTSIGWSAFEGCSGLTSVTIPNSVTFIADHTFDCCSGLTSVTIPNSITSIGNYAFSGCSGLTSLSIGSGVASIGNYAFSGCYDLTSISVEKENTKYDSRDNCNAVIESSTNVLIIGCKNTTIPNSVTSISNDAFSGCSNLTSITIPNGVTSIGKSAFSGCVGLTSINISNSVLSIGSYAFSGCSSLTTVTMGNGVQEIEYYAFKDCCNLTSISLPIGITLLEPGTFFGCTNLKTVSLPDNLSSIKSTIYKYNEGSVHGGAFEDCVNLETVNLPNSLTIIDGESFKNCKSLTSIVIPDKVIEIDGAFLGCTGLNSIVVDNANQIYDSRNNCNAIIKTATNTLVQGCNNSIIPESVKKIARYSFSGYKELAAVSFPENLIEIGEYAFNDCSGIESIFITNSITTLYDTSFEGCVGLKSIAVAPENTKYDSRDNCNAIIETASNKLILACSNTIIPASVTSFSYYAFHNCDSIALPEGMETIPHMMFYQCDKLEYLKIPASLKIVPEGAFSGCSGLKTVIFEDGNDELLFNVSYPSNYAKPQWFNNCPLDSIYLGRNIKYEFTASNSTYSNYSPFREKQTLRKVVLGDKVKIIPNSMFSGCSNLISVVIPEIMDSIGNYAFYGCEQLSSLNIPYGIKTIGHLSFYGCKRLTAIYIPETVVTIQNQAFAHCEGLNSIEIPNSVKQIDNSAFGNCTNLSNLKIQEGETSLTICGSSFSSAFYQCPISSIYLGRNIINKDYNYIYSSLGSINTPFKLTISKYVTELSGGTFAECTKITSITFEDGTDTITFIKDHNAYNSIMPFYKTPIDSIYLGRMIIAKDNYYPNYLVIPFSNMVSSFVMRIGNSITEIGNGSYSKWCISSVTLPNSINKIGLSAFSGCPLKTVIIEDGDTPLDFGEGDKNSCCFVGCPIDSIYIGRNIVYSQYSPFCKNTSVSKLVFGDNVTEICDAQFYGFSKLAQLSLPNKLQKIGKQAFYGCDGLTTLTIPYSVTEIGQQAFDLCRGLKQLSFEDGNEELNFVADLNQLNNAFVNSPIKELYLGRNICYTNMSPFMGMETLSDITIGEKVSSFGQALFGGCTKVSKVVSNIQNPFSLYDGSEDLHVFADNIYNTATLYVPKGTKVKYMTTDGWKNFFNIIEAGNVEFILGDVNRDNKVTITDAVCIVNYILGMPSAYLNIEVADINGDGKVSISDAVDVVNIVLNNGGASAPAIETPDADKSAELE